VPAPLRSGALIIGILAAIALPAFLGQRAKGQDGEAKSNARNMVSQVEASASGSGATTRSCTDTGASNGGCDGSAW
jgi:type IV pilus assembly protein PilA